MSNIAIIPARKGSKGIRNKNLVSLCNRPLIEYSIDVAVNSRNIDHVIVTSDSEEILSFSEKFGKKIIAILRPEELASDNSSTESAVMHAIQNINIENPEYIVLLQPTSPIRKVNFIDDSLRLIRSMEVNSLISVSDPVQHPYDFLTYDGNLIKYMCRQGNESRRQDFKKAKFINGSIYITKYEYFKLERKIYSLDSCVLYDMPVEFSIDIDTPLDLLFCESVMNAIKVGGI